MTIRSNIYDFEDQKYNENLNNQKKKDIGSTKEQLLVEDMKNIAHECIQIEKLKKNFSKTIFKNLLTLNFSDFISNPKFYIKESLLKKSIKNSNIRGLNIVTVDGSSITKNFMNMDFSFLKAIAVRYYFYENHNAEIKYYPDFNGFNYYSVKGNYINQDENFVEKQVSLDMNYMEINLLNKLIENNYDKNINLVIIDGSIVITPINLLYSRDREISKKYDLLLREYNKLYLNCKENGIILIGSIKDTRSSALCHLIRDYLPMLQLNSSNPLNVIDENYRQLFDYFSDLDLFNRILNKSDRSCIFNCKQDFEKIRDSGIKKEFPFYFPLCFYAFYLKPAKYDTPCRIEFFVDENHTLTEATRKADLISSIILPVSSLNEHYGLPIPQVEAHKRAVFKAEEINLLFKNLKRILNKNGLELLEKKRNRRPF